VKRSSGISLKGWHENYIYKKKTFHLICDRVVVVVVVVVMMMMMMMMTTPCIHY
jgi:hypothetical protein